MLPASPKWKILAPASHPEKVVERYYARLRQWADVLTRGDQSRSEDIVHDLYLYIALTKPDLSQVENLDNYLYQSLRHAYLSALTRATRESMQTISTTDFDSMRVALWARPTRDVLQQQNELRRICCYAVWRKAQMKGASYFVLRFFHGYGLHEITAIAGLPLSAVKPKLSEARADVREYIAGSSGVRLVGRSAAPEPIQLWVPVSWSSLSRELRATILDGRTGPCLSEWEMAMHYDSPVPKPVPAARLSHIASCEKCLASIDSIFRRPTLKDREPLDGIDGFDSNPGSGLNRKRADSSLRALLRRVEKHRQDLYQHRPETLSVAIDGRIVASHEIQAQRNVLSARAENVNQSTYVEVLSEQGLRLAMLWFDDLPPDGPHKKSQRTNLSEDRWVDLILTIDGQGLTAEVIYFAPELGVVSAADSSEDEDEPAAVLLDEGAGATENPEQVSFLPPHTNPICLEKTDRKPAIAPRSPWWRSSLNELMSAMNPTLATALVLAVVASVLLVVGLQQRQRQRMVADLLTRATAAEPSSRSTVEPGVIYQKVAIRTSRRTLERSIHRDVQGVRRTRRLQLAPEDEQLKNKLANAGVSWDAPLSVVDYAEWRHRSGATRDAVTRSGQNLLTLTTTPGAGGAVLKETLTVRDTDFHAVDRTIELRDSGTVEIAELSYDVLPWGAVNQEWFEPTSGMVSDAPAIHPAIAVRVPQPLSRLESDEIELAVRYALHGIGADLDEQINIKPGTPNLASISVTGVVSSTQRKQEILVALKGVPHVVTQLTSEEEAVRQRLPAAVMRPQPQLVSVHSPIEQQLREYFGRPEAVENFSARVTAVTANLMAHAWALRHLSERYDASDSRGESSLSLSSHQLLDTMRRDHLRAMSDGSRELAGLLRPILDSVVKGSLPESTPALPLFANTQKVRRLTLALVHGSGSPDANQGSDPTNAAKELLVALRGLELNLKEQQ